MLPRCRPPSKGLEDAVLRRARQPEDGKDMKIQLKFSTCLFHDTLDAGQRDNPFTTLQCKRDYRLVQFLRHALPNVSGVRRYAEADQMTRTVNS